MAQSQRHLRSANKEHFEERGAGAISFASGTVSVATIFLKVSNPVGIAIRVAQISWGLYSMSQ